MTDNRSPFAIPHCPNVFGPLVVALAGENTNGSDDPKESFEMTMPPPPLSSRPRIADAKLDKSDRVVDGGRDIASVLDDGGWNRVRLMSAMVFMAWVSDGGSFFCVRKGSKLFEKMEKRSEFWRVGRSQCPFRQ